MQKTFKNQQGREFLFYQLPKFDKSYSGQLTIEIELPQGNYQILCLAKDATEEQANIVVDILWNGFKNYLTLDGNVGNYKRLVKSTAKESLTSLLTSLGFKQDDNVLILEKI